MESLEMCAAAFSASDASSQCVVVGIATTGRPAILAETLRHLATLAEPPARVVVSIADNGDIDRAILGELNYPCDVLLAPKGLCAQRNAILAEVGPEALLLFLDDDFLIHDDFLTATLRVFSEEPDVVMATGAVIADGILGPGFDHDQGLAHLDTCRSVRSDETRLETYNGYGCNMAIRMSVVHKRNLQFDTTLPRYGWLEDVDFSRRLARYGRIVKDGAMRGVHLGTKTGRSRGVPLGYSQIANPVYLIRKGTMSRKRALRLMIRNMAANVAKAVRPEPWVDRPGRVRGNVLALRDLVTGRITPTRIEDL